MSNVCYKKNNIIAHRSFSEKGKKTHETFHIFEIFHILKMNEHFEKEPHFENERFEGAWKFVKPVILQNAYPL